MISVCVTTYNGEKYISQQLQSIIAQLSDSDEIVVSDDGSTDNTLAIIEQFADSRIKIFTNPSKGILSNVENSLKNSSGEIIFLADQDDVWLPNKVEIMVNALKTNALVVSDCYVTDGNLKVIENSFFQKNNSSANRYKALFLKNPYLGCCMAFRREVLQKAIPFPQNIPMHDIWIGNVAAFYFSYTLINEKLIYYRRHGVNASTASEKSNFGLLAKLKMRLDVALNLLKIKSR